MADLHKKYKDIGKDLKKSRLYSSHTAQIFHDVYHDFIEEKRKDKKNLDEFGRLKDYRFSKEDAKKFRDKLKEKFIDHIGGIKIKDIEKRYGKTFAEDILNTNIERLIGIDLDTLREELENEWVDHGLIGQYSSKVKVHFSRRYNNAILSAIKMEDLSKVRKYLAAELPKKGYKLKKKDEIGLDKAKEFFAYLHMGTLNEEVAKKHKKHLEEIVKK